MKGEVTASTSRSSFNCPHCGAFAAQTWSRVFIRGIGQNATPTVLTRAELPGLERHLYGTGDYDPEQLQERMGYFGALANGAIIEERRTNEIAGVEALNLSLSNCYACREFSVWKHEKLIYPPASPGDVANEDMPSDVRADYEEARTILNASPRGAAALLRLALQKLCAHLGEAGKDINKDIGQLVTKGLPVRIQQALDIVRVVGNESVHPGELDMRDDRDTVMSLLRLINVIIEDRITQPRQIAEMYKTLPPAKADGIAIRDANVPKKSP
jgi:hypothetical protein